MADYFWSPTSLYWFSCQCCWLWETTNRLKSINKCFMYITQDCKSTWRHLQQEDKGKLCIVIHAKINCIPIYENQPVCLKQMLNYQRLWAWCQLCYISQELILFTYTVVIKKGSYIMLLFTLEVLHAIRKCCEDCFFNVKIITWSLCCWPQDLQRLINFELTDTSNNQYCTVHGKEILLHPSYIEPRGGAEDSWNFRICIIQRKMTSHPV